MKKTGMLRQVDNLGRVVIPKELRDLYDLSPSAPVEFFADDRGFIALRRYIRTCIFCDVVTEHRFRDRAVCLDCRQALARLAFGSSGHSTTA